MDIRPSGPNNNPELHQGVRRELSGKSELRADTAHATRSRAPELSDYLRDAGPFREVRPEAVAQAKERLDNNQYTNRSNAEKIAGILLSSEAA